jgi:hypothetical protein
MAMNNIEMLADYLFEEMERLDEIDLEADDDKALERLDAEIRRAKQMGNISREITSAARVALDGMRFQADFAGTRVNGNEVKAPKILRE